MALFKRGQVWWSKFYFAGQEIRESSKSNSKMVAKNAEQQRRKELEAGFAEYTLGHVSRRLGCELVV